MDDQIKIANHNIRLYVLLRVFAKRVFLPLSAIYFVEQYGFSIQQIGLLGALFAAIQLIAEIPTGYFADRIARVTSIRLGAIFNIISTIIYVFSPNQAGIFIAVSLEAIGYCFFAGAGEALIHDSLEVKNSLKDYSKVLGRAQSVSLLINAAIMAVIPMTYGIDKRLPFLIGTVAYTALLATALRMHDIKGHVAHKKINWASVRTIFRDPRMVIFAALFGIIGALYTGPSDMFNLALKDFGLNPVFLGWLFAAASIVGSVIGLFIHILRRLSFTNYLVLDCTILMLPFAAAVTGSVFWLSIAFVVSMAFWRFRRIIYQDHLLDLYPTRYKATVISSMHNLEQINLLWVPLLVAYSVSRFGYSAGLGYIGAISLLASVFYVILGKKLSSKMNQ